LVCDVGSVTVTVGLVDMRSMRIHLITAGQNSQLQIAAEPAQRRKWAEQHENGEAILRRLLMDDVRRLSKKIMEAGGVDISKVKAICCTGHSMMLSLIANGMTAGPGKVLCYPASGLTRLPEYTNIPAYIMPAAGKKLSAELVACCLAADLYHKKDNPDITLLLSLGQEGYVVAAGQGRLLAAHVPSMPFEGYGIRWGIGWGTMAGFIFGGLNYFIGNGIAIDWTTILCDYFLAFAMLGLGAGLFKGKKHAVYFGSLVGGGLQFLASYLVGVFVWGKWMPEEFLGLTMTTPWFYSFLYNGLWAFPNIALALVVFAALQKPMGKYIRGEDLLGV